MTDDKLLRALADAARKDKAADRLDPRWDAYSAGTLDEAQAKDLIDSAAQRSEPAATEEAFRPLDQDFRAALHDKARATLAAESEAETVEVSTLSLPERRRPIAAPLALAASLMLGVALSFFMLSGDDDEFAALPGYAASLQGGSEFRSTDPRTGTPVFEQGDRLELRLTPTTAVAGAVTGVVIASGNGELRPLDGLRLNIAKSGAARVVGHIGSEIALDPGDYVLLVAIGRDGALPPAGQLQKALQISDPTLGPGWQAWSFAITIKPHP